MNKKSFSVVDIDELPLQSFLTFRLARVQAKLNAQANAILKDHGGLTLAQWRILVLIGSKGKTRLSDIAQASDIDKGLLSRNLKAMIASKVVKSRHDKDDNRVQHLSLTAKGRSLFQQGMQPMRQRQDYLREILSEQELSVLHSALDRLEVAAETRW